MKGFLFSPYILVRRGNYVNASALMAKEDYLAAGGFDEELADYALEDWDFWLTMLERGKRGTYRARSAPPLAAPRRGKQEPRVAGKAGALCKGDP